MRVIIKRYYFISKADLVLIRKQLKEKGLKMKDIYTNLGISRTYLYDQLYGKRACSYDLLTWFQIHEIKLYFEGEVIENGF